MKRLVVYSKDGCPFCSLLKHELRLRRIAYTEVDLSKDETRKKFYESSGTNSVPQVYVTEEEFSVTQPSGERLGGWDETSKLLDSLPDRLT